MFWSVSVAVVLRLLFVVSLSGASVLGPRRYERQTDSNAENAIIEIFNACKCVYYYQCDANNYVITSGETLINVRMDTNIPRIQCKGGSFPSEIVCCKLNSTTTTLKPALKSNENTQVPEKANEAEPTKLKKLTCGAQRTIINVRIFTGEDDLTPMEGEFPWIAAIFKKSSSGNYKFHCSGSLIHLKAVLTANHCVHRKKPGIFIVVVNGKINLSLDETKPEEKRNVSEIVHHPEYNAGGLFNDAALLILDEAFTASKQNHINTLCLPPGDVNLEGSKCLVAGWGKDNEGKKNHMMKKVELPFVDYNQCQTLLRNTRLGENFSLHKSFMCAGGEKGRDACKGDGGSPLMCPMPSEENRYFQAGIVSWGIDCGQENVPGVYGNVEEMMEWIKSALQERQLQS